MQKGPLYVWETGLSAKTLQNTRKTSFFDSLNPIIKMGPKLPKVGNQYIYFECPKKVGNQYTYRVEHSTLYVYWCPKISMEQKFI